MEINVKTKYDLGNKVFFIGANDVAHHGVIKAVTIKTDMGNKSTYYYTVEYGNNKKESYLYDNEVYTTADDLTDKVLKEIRPLINFV